MKTKIVRSDVPHRGATAHLELSEGSAVVKIYSSTQTKGTKTYHEHRLVYSVGGKRIRHGFSDLAEAKAEAGKVLTKLGNCEVQALGLTSRDHESYLMAKEELQSLNVSLPIIAREYREAAMLLGGKGTILDAARHFVANGVGDLPKKTVREAIADFLTAKSHDGLSDVYLKDLRLRLTKFAGSFPGQISDIKTVAIESWLRDESMAARTRNNYAASITSLFRFARRSGYLPKDSTAAENLTRARAVEDEVTVYSPIDAARILRKVQFFREDLVPMVAIMAFAGLRTAEVQRLTWEEINFDQGTILVAAKKAKTGQRRHVPIQSNLMAWLLPYRGRKGLVCPFLKAQTTIQRIVSRAQTDNGKKVWEAIEWKRNAFRHSYGSYRLPIVKSVAEVSLEMGNSPRMVLQHYRQLVTLPEAEAYWKIMPSGAIASVTAIASA